jgi:hypothetical protein
MTEGCFVKTMRWLSETERRHALKKPATPERRIVGL